MAARLIVGVMRVSGAVMLIPLLLALFTGDWVQGLVGFAVFFVVFIGSVLALVALVMVSGQSLDSMLKGPKKDKGKAANKHRGIQGGTNRDDY